MVTVKLMGGLGNQMFQYAIGRSLAHDLSEKLYLDASFYDRRHSLDTTPRHYELYHLNVKGNIIKRGHLCRLRMFFLENLMKRYPFICQEYVLEKNLTYNPSVINKGYNMYLDGYWQCERYFLHNEAIIRQDFQVITPQSDVNKRWSELISRTTSVCLHVRRGDYVTNAVANSTHGLCSLEYYHHAIKYISENVENPVFFVFSDDMEWTKAMISISHEAHYMDHNGPEEDYEDLHLMMQCKHFIIANSSFSWWGAWLGNDKNKIVICPRFWFNDPYLDTDIIPESWVRL